MLVPRVICLVGLMLPIAFGLDLLVIPGIHVLTAYTAWVSDPIRCHLQRSCLPELDLVSWS